jgi:hypothetical protein
MFRLSQSNSKLGAEVHQPGAIILPTNNEMCSKEMTGGLGAWERMGIF